MGRNLSSEELRLSLPLLEEAANLLRQTPPRAWACYLLGTGPFVLGVIQFWSLMSGPAPDRAQPLAWAFLLAALHLWMRVWQGRFATLLLDLRGGRDSAPWPAAAWLRAAASQLRYGAPAFAALLPALLIMLPYGWVYAFYQSLAVTAHEPHAAARAWKAARHSPFQNHAALTLLALCNLVAFVNVFTVLLLLPGLVKLFVPVEWAFTRYPFWFLNTTALCVMLLLTYLLTDPLAKAVYVLRAFHGLSRASGEDLLTDWRRLRPPAARPRGARLPAAAVALLLLFAAAPLSAAPGSVPAAVPAGAFEAARAGALTAAALDAQIDLALRHPRYDWRTPMQSAPPESWLARQLQRLTDTLSRWTRSVFDALRRFADGLRHLFRPHAADPDHEPAGLSPGALSQLLTAVLLATAAALLFLLWRSRTRPAAAPLATALPQTAAPDVADESVTAEVLPDDEWLLLAERLRAAHDYRKSARAFFLALLACLARKNLIALRKSKTNADYLRELRRRTVGHLFDEQPFRKAAGLFEAGWYGDHPVTSEALDDLRGQVEAYRHD